MAYHLRGRVVRAEDETGVPGLDVTVIDSDHQFDDLLGRTRTDEEGRFSVSYSETDYAFEELFERDPEIYVRVRDRNGHTLHTDDEARPFPPSGEEHVIEVDADALDPLGGALPAAGLRWLVDGDEVAVGTRTAVADGLDAGEHEVTLEYRDDDESVAESATITVLEPTEAQLDHRRLMAELD